MKKLSVFLILLCMIIFPAQAFASTGNDIEDTDVAYCEVTIEEDAPPLIQTMATTKTKSGSRTHTFYNSAGKQLWYVKVSGTFTYNGSTSKCTASSVTAASSVSNWKMSNKSASKSGATATAKATAKLYSGSSVVQTINQTAKVSCSKSGVLS